MNSLELLTEVYRRREAGEATACQVCVSKCLSDKKDKGQTATDQDQAICFSECGCSRESFATERKNLDDMTIAELKARQQEVERGLFDLHHPTDSSTSFGRGRLTMSDVSDIDRKGRKLLADIKSRISKKGTELDDDGMNLWWDSRPSDRERTRKLRAAGITDYPSKGPPDHGFIRRFDALPENVKKALRKFAGGESMLPNEEQDVDDWFDQLDLRQQQSVGINTNKKLKFDQLTSNQQRQATGEFDDLLQSQIGGEFDTTDPEPHTCRKSPDDLSCLCPECDTDADQFNNMSCKVCKRSKGFENCGCKFNKFAGESLKRMEKTYGMEVAFMFSKIIGIEGMKIKGKLAYAGVSHNNRLYLPEALQKGDRMELPMIFNHASPDGAEFELSRLPTQIRESILNHEQIRVGDVRLNWDAENLTLFYQGEVTDEFFASEIDKGLMSVSLGMLFDADSPEICDQECYTVVKGAEFTEVSLVYHPGFPIATIESNEIRLKKRITPRRYRI